MALARIESDRDFDINLDEINQQFETARPEEILTWVWATFAPEIAATSSFQTQSVPLLHMIARTIPQFSIYFLDTGFHFPETLVFRDQLINVFGLNVINLSPEKQHDVFQQEYGDLYLRDPDMCCYINKIEPLQRAMKGKKAWISGIRRDQTEQRRTTPIVSFQADGTYKICPLATWTRRDVWQYIAEHRLPEHPLLAQGYLSIGCAPCTRPVYDDSNDRVGRWVGQQKTECGIHTVNVFQVSTEEIKHG